MDMPVVDIDKLKGILSDEDFKIAVQCLVKRKDTYRLRASKPMDPIAAYVWRMAAFIASPHRQHHCMPMGADFGIQEKHFAHRTEVYHPICETDFDRQTVASWDQRTWDIMNKAARRNAFIKKELDPITDSILNSIDKTELHGLLRWGRAFGHNI